MRKQLMLGHVSITIRKVWGKINNLRNSAYHESLDLKGARNEFENESGIRKFRFIPFAMKLERNTIWNSYVWIESTPFFSQIISYQSAVEEKEGGVILIAILILIIPISIKYTARNERFIYEKIWIKNTHVLKAFTRYESNINHESEEQNHKRLHYTFRGDFLFDTFSTTRLSDFVRFSSLPYLSQPISTYPMLIK